MKRNLIIFVVLIASFTPKLSGNVEASPNVRVKNFNSNSLAQKRDDLRELPQYVAALMKKLQVTPGLAIAVVRGDKVIFSQGFGYRDIKGKLPVTPQTGFYIASTTKSFTGTAAKLLAEEGKLDLDAPVKKYFPNLVLKAPLSTEQISLRDLLTHRSGINNEAINIRTAYTGQYDSEALLKLLADYSKPISPEFRYSNIGYIVGALAMERATGESWRKTVERKILAPLEMNQTTAFVSKGQASGNFALPYVTENGSFVELPYKQDNTMHAAGGMISSAEDLAKWLIANMNGGKYKGKQAISAAALEEILSPQINQNREFYKFKRYAYGLGWNIGTYNGEKFVHCFGEFPGFRPHVSFMPAHNLGVVVLANESVQSFTLPDLIATDIYDFLLQKKPLQVNANPKIGEYIADLQKNKEERAKKAAAKLREKESQTPPSFELKAYAGIYENAELGQILISTEANSLVARFGNLVSSLAPVKGDTFEANVLAGDASLTFKGDRTGVSEFTMFGKTFAKVQ
ncbi:MAG: serine hydrolase [Acidobacteriota bacterium]|nr:serine hydrolase [Acidobacteriota bacterium]